MRFLLCGSGTYEILWSLQAALIEAGHESVISLPDISQDIIDRTIDVVVMLNLFQVPRDDIEMLSAYIATKGRKPLLVHVSLKHPLEEMNVRSREEILDAERWMAGQNVVIWCMCQGVTAHCRRLGFTRIFHAPLGLARWIYAHRLGDSDAVEMYKLWMSRRDPNLARFPYHTMKDGDVEAVAGQIEKRILYLGQGWPDDQPPDDHSLDDDIIRDAGRVAAVMRESPCLTRIEAIDAVGLSERAGDPGWSLAFNQAFKLKFAVRNRARFVGSLEKIFGRSLAVWGNGWERHGVAARPVSSKPRNCYDLAACCLDVGSLAYDTAIFPRTLEIIKRDGLIFTWRHADSGQLLGPCSEDMSFENEADMMSKAEKMLTYPDYAQSVKKRHLEWAFENLGFSTFIENIQQICLSQQEGPRGAGQGAA